ncbi:hypothetical protein [Azospirillum halopraeferens]|uniref:hypothetical protein n=1 Tax=Azospirillum halopraeferens TaxID=34010 RepID=UPI0003F85DF3|nr:hypothetical protein [Azospirillum halopraeferens]
MMDRHGDGRRRTSDALLLALFVLAGVTTLDRFGRPTPGVSLDELPVRTAGLDPPPAAERVRPAAPVPEYDRVAAMLATIRVEPENRRGFDPAAWPHWLDRDGNCLDTREEVLVAESLEPVRLSLDGCAIVSGRWRDPYSGEQFTNPQDMAIDHRVPLREAHASGGHAWDAERRAAFANDLDGPDTLVAVSAATRRAKGARGPEEWLPADSSALCSYVVGWVAVKARWELSMDARERMAVGNILANCHARLARGGTR